MDTLYKYWDFITYFYLLGRYFDKKYLRQSKEITFELHWKVTQSFLINFIILYFISITARSALLNDNFSFGTPHGAVVLIILLTLYFSLNAFLAYMLGILMRVFSLLPDLKEEVFVFRKKLKTLKLVRFKNAPKSTLQLLKPLFLSLFIIFLYGGIIIAIHFLQTSSSKSNAKQVTAPVHQSLKKQKQNNTTRTGHHLVYHPQSAQ